MYGRLGYEASVPDPAQVTLDSDNVFGDGTTTGDVSSGYAVSLAVGVDTTTTPTGGRLTGDGAPAGAPAGGGGPDGARPGGPPPSGAPN